MIKKISRRNCTQSTIYVRYSVLKSVTETSGWKTLMAISCRVCFFPSARIRCAGPSGDGGLGQTFSPVLFYIGDRPERLEKAFEGIGVVWGVPGKKIR
jgi:hypothetical protein